MCSTASSWVGFNDSRSTGLEYNSRYRPIPHQILPRSLCRSTFTLLAGCSTKISSVASSNPYLQLLDRRFVTAWIGEDRLTAGREQLWYEAGEGSSVLTLVEDVRGEDQVVGSNTPVSGSRQSRTETFGSRSRFVRAL